MQGIKDELPKLMAATSAASSDATAVVQKSTQAPTTTQDELDSMTNLLVDYVGPIAKYIMVAQNRAKKWRAGKYPGNIEIRKRDRMVY